MWSCNTWTQDAPEARMLGVDLRGILLSKGAGKQISQCCCVWLRPEDCAPSLTCLGTCWSFCSGYEEQKLSSASHVRFQFADPVAAGHYSRMKYADCLDLQLDLRRNFTMLLNFSAAKYPNLLFHPDRGFFYLVCCSLSFERFLPAFLPSLAAVGWFQWMLSS